jgi:hypothetical protein
MRNVEDYRKSLINEEYLLGEKLPDFEDPDPDS